MYRGIILVIGLLIFGFGCSTAAPLAPKLADFRECPLNSKIFIDGKEFYRRSPVLVSLDNYNDSESVVLNVFVLSSDYKIIFNGNVTFIAGTTTVIRCL